MPGRGIGHLIKERRKQLGMTLIELSRKSRIHPSNISRVELGERKATAEFLIKLAPALSFSRLGLLSLAGYLDKGEY